MDYIPAYRPGKQGKPRSQIVLIESSLEETIEQDNPVRIIDAFVNSCNLAEFDYTLMKSKKKVDGEVGLIFIAYLFTRMQNILGLGRLKEAISAFISGRLKPFTLIKQQITCFRKILEYLTRKNRIYRFCLNSL